MASEAIQQAIQLLAETIGNLTKSKYTSAAGLTVVLYDILLLMSDEIRLVWQTPRNNPSRYCYFINRYAPPIFLLVANYQLAGFRGPLSDRIWISIASLAQVITGICATYILVLRVLALYGGKRALKIVLYATFIASYGVCLGITISAVKVIHENAGYNPLAKVCAIESTPPIFRGIFIAPVFFEVLIGILTVWKAWQHAYVLSNASAAPMLYTMFRDGLLWFMAVVGLRVWNAMIWVFLPQSMIYLGIYLLWALVSTFISRFFLNILDVASTNVDGFSEDFASARTKEVAAARTIGGTQGRPSALIAMSDFTNTIDDDAYGRQTSTIVGSSA